MDGNECALEHMNTVIGYIEYIVCESISQSISLVHAVQPVGQSLVVERPSGRKSYRAESSASCLSKQRKATSARINLQVACGDIKSSSLSLRDDSASSFSDGFSGSLVCRTRDSATVRQKAHECVLKRGSLELRCLRLNTPVCVCVCVCVSLFAGCRAGLWLVYVVLLHKQFKEEDFKHGSFRLGDKVNPLLAPPASLR